MYNGSYLRDFGLLNLLHPIVELYLWYLKYIFVHPKKNYYHRYIYLLNLYKILYLESQSMSHGCGYLYFANQGAWMEDVNILSFLDLALGNILNKMVVMWKTSELFGEDETEFVNFLKSKRDEMDRLISAKAKTFKAVPRVNKVF